MRTLISALLLAGVSILSDAPQAQHPFLEKLEARLQSLPAAAVERSALETVPVRIGNLREELGTDFSPTIGGIHTEDGILLSSSFLDGLYSEIRTNIPNADTDAVMEIAASQFAPLLAHELRHQVDGDEVGISSFGYQESELSARTLETAVIAEARTLFSEDFKYETSLTRAQSNLLGLWETHGPDGLRAYDRKTVAANFPSLAKGDDLLGLSDRVPQARQLSNLLIARENRGPPSDAWFAKVTGGSLRSKREAEQFIRQGEEISTLLQRLPEIQWYFVERERDAWRAWRDADPNRSL